MSVKKTFARYVSQNILGMIGLSCYILADTYFISKAMGADGITALNLVLPVYNLIFAIGAMIGVGSAIRFVISKTRGEADADFYFSNALLFAFGFGMVFLLIGLLIPDKVVALLGGDERITAVGESYTRIFMLFAPCFMWNQICNAFVRNDGNPSVAMAATLFSSLFNIVMDYVLMFPCRMGMSGAALATACSPLVGICVCCIHFRSKDNTVVFRLRRPSFSKLFGCCRLGVASFVGEISSGVITVVFNMILLHLAGNTGVAAYGVVANTSLVAVSVFNGVAQGAQPLISENYGRGNRKNVRTVMEMGVITSVCLAAAMLCLVCFFAKEITAAFNSEHSEQLAEYAQVGLKLYFTGFLFAGVNIVGSSFLSAVESAKWAFVISVMRGFVVIILCAFILSAMLGMNGVWLAFPSAELITAAVTAAALAAYGKHSRNRVNIRENS